MFTKSLLVWQRQDKVLKKPLQVFVLANRGNNLGFISEKCKKNGPIQCCLLCDRSFSRSVRHSAYYMVQPIIECARRPLSCVNTAYILPARDNNIISILIIIKRFV